MSDKRMQVMIEDATTMIENHINTSRNTITYELTNNGNGGTVDIKFFCYGGKAEIDYCIVTANKATVTMLLDNKQVEIPTANTYYNTIALSKGEHIIKFSCGVPLFGGLMRISAVGARKIEN